MRYLGTSGWSYPAFTEKLYKEKMSGIDQLTCYAKTFNSVEINYSFYHIPKAQTFRNWFVATPEDFGFAIKLHRQFTHENKLLLTTTSKEQLRIFLQNAGELKDKFKVLLIQTPPGLIADISVLKIFLKHLTGLTKTLPHIPHVAFEFRNESWFSQEIYELLEKHKAAVVISQSATHPEKHLVLSGIIYLRLHGPEKMFDSSYTPAMLHTWHTFLDQHPQAVCYIYFNNTMNGRSIQDALYLQNLENGKNKILK